MNADIPQATPTVEKPEATPVEKPEATPVAACCAPSAQSTCCEPSEKSSCCGPDATAGGSCGCQ